MYHGVLWVRLSCFSHVCPVVSVVQINVGTTVTMTGNGTRPPPTPSAEAPPAGAGQASSLAPSSTTVESSNEGASPPGPAPPPTTSHPRVIRISHQSVEPVVMMHMNIQGELGTAAGKAEQSSTRRGLGLVLRCGGARVGKERPRLMAVAKEAEHRLFKLACVGRGRKNSLSSESCVHGKGSVSSPFRWE